MAIKAEDFIEQFDGSFTERRDNIYATIPKQYPMIVREESMNSAFVKTTSISQLGMPVKGSDGDEVFLDRPVKGLSAAFIPQTYKLGYSIERSAIEDGQTSSLQTRPITMLTGSVLVRDLAACDLLNNGTVLQPYDLGGKPLFAVDHAREDGGPVWSNRIPTQLPLTVQTVFQAVMDMLYNLRDERGNLIAYSGTIHLIVPGINATLVQSAIEVINSMMNPHTSDNAVNAVTAMFNLKYVVCRYTTDPNAWYVAWEPSAQGYGLALYNRQEPDISPLEPYKGNRDVWASRMRMRFVAGYDAKRGIARVG